MSQFQLNAINQGQSWITLPISAKCDQSTYHIAANFSSNSWKEAELTNHPSCQLPDWTPEILNYIHPVNTYNIFIMWFRTIHILQCTNKLQHHEFSLTARVRIEMATCFHSKPHLSKASARSHLTLDLFKLPRPFRADSYLSVTLSVASQSWALEISISTGDRSVNKKGAFLFSCWCEYSCRRKQELVPCMWYSLGHNFRSMRLVYIACH